MTAETGDGISDVNVKAFRYAEHMRQYTDIPSPFPAWHGWALQHAYKAGYAERVKEEQTSFNETVTRLEERIRELQQDLDHCRES